MGNSNTEKPLSKIPSIEKLQDPPLKIESTIIPFNTFCGTTSNQETLKNTKKTEIDLTSTYSLPKGSYTQDSIRLFTQNEKNLFYIISTNNISALRYLTINNVNINILDEDRTSPLHIACKNANIQMIEEIINQGAMINIPDIVGWTSLHIACFYNRPDVVLLLLKNGANYKTKNREKETPKDLAIKVKGFICVNVIDNFVKYQKKEMEKFIMDLNNKDKGGVSKCELYEDIMKKYMTYQKLRGEYLQTHDDFFDRDNCDDEDLNDNLGDDVFVRNNVQFNNHNLNYEKYKKEKEDIEKIEKYINLLSKEMSNRKENKIFNKDNNNNYDIENNKSIDMEKYFSATVKSTKEKKHEELLSKYKYIPHKHKFYLNYKFENGTFKSRTFSDEIKENKILIHMPSSLPSMTSMNSLNKLKKSSTITYPKNNNNNNNNNNNIINNEIFDINEEEIYKTYSFDENNSRSSSNDSLDIEIDNNKKKMIINDNNNSLVLNKDEQDDYDEDKTLSIDDENIAHNLIVENSRNILNDQVIFKNISNKFYKFSNCDFSIFLTQHNDIFEEILYVLFYFDYYFGLMFLISVCNINNSILNLISYITSNIFDKKLKMLILTNSNPFILKIYFNSFYFSNNSVIDSIYKSFKYFSLSKNNIAFIDQLSRAFSESYFEQIQNKNEHQFKSQNSIYYFTFAFIITELNYKNAEDKEKIIFDMIVMLKNLNEGKNFNKQIINEAITNIKSEKNNLGIIEENEYHLYIDNKNYLTMYENDGKIKIYNYFYSNGLFVLFYKNNLCKFFYVKIQNKIKCHINKSNNLIKIFNSNPDNKNYLYIIKNNNDNYEMIPCDSINFQVNSTIIINDLEKFFSNKSYK